MILSWSTYSRVAMELCQQRSLLLLRYNLGTGWYAENLLLVSLAGLGGCWKHGRRDSRGDYFKIHLLSVQLATLEKTLQINFGLQIWKTLSVLTLSASGAAGKVLCERTAHISLCAPRISSILPSDNSFTEDAVTSAPALLLLEP